MDCIYCRKGRSSPTYDVCSLSPEWDVNVPLEIKYDNFLTTLESELVAKKWKYMTEGGKDIEFGFAFFEKFFMYAPETLAFFFRTQDKELAKSQEWWRHPLFISHIRRVMNGIDLIITLLHHPRDLASYLKYVRELHQQVPDNKKIYVEIFVKTLEDTVASNFGTVYTPEYKKVFRKFFTKLYLLISQDLTN